MKGVSQGIAVVLLILVAVVVIAAIYTMVSPSIGRVSSVSSVIRGYIRIQGIKPGIGFIDIYVWSSVNTTIDTIYIHRCGSTNPIAVVHLPRPIAIRSYTSNLVHVPLIGLGVDITTLPPEVCISLGTANEMTLVSQTPIDLGTYLALAAEKSTIGFVAGRDYSCSVGDRRISVDHIHWVYVNLVTGEYRFKYIEGSESVESKGRATFVYGSNVLDLRSTDWDKRYKLGPIVIFVNPYYAAKDYVVKVIDIYGNVYTFKLSKLVDYPEKVSLDILALWEDLWWPNTKESLDNYVDHVVRLTVFTNNSVRIEVIHASGCYIHFFLLNPPPFDKVPSIAKKYMEKSFRLDPSDGVVYVKTHGASVPPLDPNDIWDPVRGVWVENWPPVFRR